MGSYFSKKQKPKETPFELLERKVEGMNPNSYPSFEKSLDWSKTKHIYSDSICINEKYVSYGVLTLIFGFLFCLLFVSFRKKPEEKNQGQSFSEQDRYDGEGLDIQIGDDVQ